MDPKRRIVEIVLMPAAHSVGLAGLAVCTMTGVDQAGAGEIASAAVSFLGTGSISWLLWATVRRDVAVARSFEARMTGPTSVSEPRGVGV